MRWGNFSCARKLGWPSWTVFGAPNKAMAESRWQVGVGQTSSFAWGMNLYYSMYIHINLYIYIQIYSTYVYRIYIFWIYIDIYTYYIMCIFYTYSIMEYTDDTLNSIHNFTLVQFQFQSHALLFSLHVALRNRAPGGQKVGAARRGGTWAVICIKDIRWFIDYTREN